MGFVTEVVSPADFDATVEGWCEKILRCAPLSIAASKQAIHRGLDEPGLEAAMAAQEAYPAFHKWRRAADTREGPKAFAEKRAPRWTGK